MIANIDNVVKWLEINKLEYWQVLLKDADNSNVFESDEAGFAANAKRFRDVMELCSGSRFFIKASEKKGINRGKFYEEFKNVPETPQVNGVQQTPTVTGVPQEDVKRQIDDAIAGFKTSLKIEALEAENKELKQTVREHDNMTTRVLGKIEPYIGTLISTFASKLLPQSTPIVMAGIESVNEVNNIVAVDDQEIKVIDPEPDNKDQQRLITALEKWEKADPDFLSLIEAVANLAESGDATYKMAKGMLLK